MLLGISLPQLQAGLEMSDAEGAAVLGVVAVHNWQLAVFDDQCLTGLDFEFNIVEHWTVGQIVKVYLVKGQSSERQRQ